MKLTCLLVLMVALTGSPALAQNATRLSFGLEITSNPKRLPGCKSEEPNMYMCDTVPRPHPAFESYLIYHVDGVGICAVTAMGVDVLTSRTGFDLRSAADSLMEQVTTQYGAGKKVDGILPSSIWHEPGDWTMSIIERDRMYGMLWSANSGFIESNGIQGMAVMAKALSPTKGYVTYTIESKVHGLCKQKRSSDHSSVF